VSLAGALYLGTIDRSNKLIGRFRAFEQETGFVATVVLEKKYYQEDRTRTGISNPNWRTQIRDGQNATTPLSGVYTSISSNPLRYALTYYNSSVKRYRYIEGSGDGALTCPQIGFPTTACTLSSVNAINKASAKFYKKIRLAQVQMSGPTFLGELAETARMLRKPAAAIQDKVRGYLGKLGKAKRANPKTWTKTIADTWLEQSFGWAPLIHDAQDAAKAYSRLGEKRDSGPVVAGFIDTADAPFPYNPLGNYTVTQSNNKVRWFMRGRAIDQVTVRFKGHLLAQPEMTPWDNFALFGFTPSEFVPTAWELLPYSFLVDYFTNIGDILSSSVTSTARLAWSNRTIRSLRVTLVTPVMDMINTDNANAGWSRINDNSSGGACTCTKSTISRTVGGLELPSLQFNLELGLGQGLNLAALIASANGLFPQKRNFHL
jgi:hypothetical protein